MKDAVVVIIGAGPAGARAAERLAKAGRRPIVLDENRAPGGQIYRQPPQARARPYSRLYGFEAGKAAAVHRVFRDHASDIDYRPNTLVWNIAGDRIDHVGEDGSSSLRFDRLILATGAVDRAVPFPGWTLPGVFTLGAAQVALKAQDVAIGRRVALVGAGPLLPLVGYQYVKAGAEVAALLDLTPFAGKVTNAPAMLRDIPILLKGLYYLAYTKLRGVTAQYGVSALSAIGMQRVEGLRWVTASGRGMSVACDAIGISMGLRSETQLAQLAGCRMSFDMRTRQYLPLEPAPGRTSRDDVFVAGDGAGIAGADMAEVAGERAALQVLQSLGEQPPQRLGRIDAAMRRRDRFRQAIESAYPYPAHLFEKLADSVPLCRCENVSVGELRAAIRQFGETDLNRLKAQTRVGMGRCQGRVCGQAAAEIVAHECGTSPADAGYFRVQAPLKPIPMARLAPKEG